MVTAADHLEPQELLSYLEQLTEMQDELLALLIEKREAISSRELSRLKDLAGQELAVQEKMAGLQSQRTKMIEAACQRGVSCKSLEELAVAKDPSGAVGLTTQVEASKHRMRLLQHETLTNWVVEQKSLLHISRMLEIIACGGRLQPTYGKGAESHRRGSLVDREA
jgi:hypothetical protein